jgi:uncharacterized SAM-binding protein YcdF (DUF218 family)
VSSASLTDPRPAGAGIRHASSSASAPSRRSPRLGGRRRWIVRAVLALVVLLVVYLAASFAQVLWASRHDEAQRASAIVVLGAAQWNGKPSPVLRQRLDHAADLYRRDIADTIVVVGGKQEGDHTTEGKAGYDYLRAKGVPDTALKVEVGGTDTYEELSATALILQNARLGDDVVLVTDPYHAFRSAEVAGEVGLDAHVSPTEDDASVAELIRESGAVAVGRIIGYRRLSNWS